MNTCLSYSLTWFNTTEGFESVHSKIIFLHSLKMRGRSAFLRFSEILLGSLSLAQFSLFLCCTNLNHKSFCSSRHARTPLKQKFEEPHFVLIKIKSILSRKVDLFSRKDVYDWLVIICNKKNIWHKVIL